MSREKLATAAHPGPHEPIPAGPADPRPGDEATRPDGHGAPGAPDLIAIGNALARSEAAHFRDLAALAGAQADPMQHRDAAAGAPAPLLIFDEEPLAGAGALLESDDDADPLASLLAEYRRALIHRERDHDAHQLKAIERPQVAMPLPEDPFLDARGRFETGSLLGDLLGSQQNIDLVLGEMDNFRADHLFAEDDRHEILALLAPARKAGRALSQAALLARQEHHLISVDSHFPTLVARTDADARAAAEIEAGGANATTDTTTNTTTDATTDTAADAQAHTDAPPAHPNPSPEPQDDEQP
ncbi:MULTISPECIES: TagK domain-containing protein [Cupriavidus]